MADTVNIQTLVDGRRHVVVNVTAESDGTGLSNSTLINISGLNPVPTKLSLEEIWFAVQGYEAVKITSDRDTDHVFGRLSGDGYFDYREYGALIDEGTGGTGDILISTIGTAATNDTFDMTLSFRKKF